jgi:hypothetical protein
MNVFFSPHAQKKGHKAKKAPDENPETWDAKTVGLPFFS